MLDRLKRVFGRNKRELQEIEQKGTGVEHFSSDAIEDRKEILKDDNAVIERLDYYTDAYNKAERENDTQRKSINRKKIGYFQNIIQKSTQGKVRDVISSYFGQLDKKIHNFRYNQKTTKSDVRWNKHRGKVLARYDDLSNYAINNGFIVMSLFGISFFVGKVSSISVPLATFISNTSLVMSGIVTANFIAKGMSTLYNKKKFGGPLLTQEAKVYRGKYFENIQNAKYALHKSRELTGKIEFLDEDRPIALGEGETKVEILEKNPQSSVEVLEKVQEIEKTLLEKSTSVLAEEEPIKPDIRNYGNINFGFMRPLETYQTEEGKLPYSKAISATRRVDAHLGTEEELEKKIAAYDKLYQTFGKGKPRKKKNPDSTRKLSDYNQTLKSLSEYGRIVHSGNATEKEYNTYMGLLYHLGKDDDFITDYLSDEYDRYMADKEEYEKKMVKKIK